MKWSGISRTGIPWGALRIGSSITIGAALIPKAVALYSQQYPDVEIKMVIDNSQVIEKKVLANEVDFGLLEGAVHDPNLVAQDFAEDQMLLVAAPGHPLAQKEQPLLPQDLKSQRFLLRERGSGVRELFESVLLAHDLSVEPSWGEHQRRIHRGSGGPGAGGNRPPLRIGETGPGRRPADRLDGGGDGFPAKTKDHLS